jgi:hypothetical protein
MKSNENLKRLHPRLFHAPGDKNRLRKDLPHSKQIAKPGLYLQFLNPVTLFLKLFNTH